MCEPVLKFDSTSHDEFAEGIRNMRMPLVLKGADIGPCVKKWTVQYLSKLLGSANVKVHVTTNPMMDFCNKNFVYRTLPFGDLLKRADEVEHTDFFLDKNEMYYLRSLGNDPRKDIADLFKQFPQLMQDLVIPPVFPAEKFFSSVFRIGSAGVQLWTHYDIMDNILIQIVGRKRVVLFSPQDASYMYLNGDKSEVLDIDNPCSSKFPNFMNAKKYEAVLYPGDIIFIPALWFHNTKALDFNIAINVFWKHLDDSLYDTKDVYGNKDLLPAVQAFSFVDRALKLLENLPEDYKDFYGRRLVEKIKNKTFIHLPNN